jgi:methylenetetrahydrofolate dehydrogenase (NADP+)/methenyltetrahydrofolate cyclohydrolase
MANMIKILDGKKLSLKQGEILKKKILHLSKKPRLVIIQIGNRTESNTYIKRKKEFGEYLGVDVVHAKYKSSISEKELIKNIKQFNSDESVQGIIIQIPLPKHLDPNKLVEYIDEGKDVDGQTSKNLKALIDGKPGYIPATTKGIMTLLEKNNIPLKGTSVCVVGRSTLVGKPTALEFLNRNATVTVCHSKTKNLKRFTTSTDILVVAVGKANFIDEKFIKRGQVVIDVGINPITKNGKIGIVGDVNTKNVLNKVKAITPVPGGVGPMTILSLFENLILGCS